MSDQTDNWRSLVSIHTMEIATAIAIMAFAAVVMVSNYRAGRGLGQQRPADPAISRSMSGSSCSSRARRF